MAGGELFGEVGLDGDTAKAGLGGDDTAQIGVEPVADCAVHGVVVGVHAGVLLHLEALPDGGGLVLEHEAEGGVLVGGDDLPRVLDVAVLGQHIHEVAGVEVARGELVVLLHQVVSHDLGGLGLTLGGQDPQPQGEGLTAHGAGSHLARLGIEPLVQEGLSHVFGTFGILGLGLGTARAAGEVGQELAVVVGVARGHDHTGGHRAGCALVAEAGVGGSRPVAVVGVVHGAVGTAGQEVVLPGGHAVEELVHSTQLAVVHQCLLGGHQVGGADGIGGESAVDEGSTAGKLSLGALLVLDVLEDLGEDAGGIEVVGGLLKAHGSVVHPGHALVALGAVGEDGVHIVPLGHDQGLLDGVDHGGATGEGGAVFQIGVDETRVDHFGLQVVQARDLAVAEAVVGEQGRPEIRVAVVARSDVGIGLLGTAQNVGVDGTVLVQLLGEGQGDGLPRFQIIGEPQLGHARDVLAEVHHEHTGLGGGDLLGLVERMGGDGLEDHGAHLPTGGGDSLDGELVAVVKFDVQGGVKGLAVEDGGGAGTESAFPGHVGGNILGGAILIVNVEVGPQDAVAVEFDLTGTQHGPHEVGAVLAPAGGDLDLQLVFALLELTLEQMVDAVVAGLCVVGVGGVEAHAVQGPAVEHGVVIAQTAVVQHRALHGLVYGELLVEPQ